jgi:tetratricopeptide (TPR) repeat protein
MIEANRETIANDDQHNEIYKRGTGLVSPYMRLLGKIPKMTQKAHAEVSRGIKDLDAVTAYNPQNWAAFWVKGKGYQALGNHALARTEFMASLSIQRGNSDVARECAESCLQLGLGDEAVEILQYAIGLNPGDAGLQANLAMAFLISGKNQQAKTAIEKSLCMSSEDGISKFVGKVVEDVISGRRKQPKTIADLESSKALFFPSKANLGWIVVAIIGLIVLSIVLAHR